MSRGSITLRAAALLVLTNTPVAAQQRDSDVDRYAVVADHDLLVGHYRMQEGEFSIDVHLNADRTALYEVTMDKRGGGIRAQGVWDVRSDRVHIHNQPGPVSLAASAAPTRDPSVNLSIVATLPDGSPAEGLAVTWPEAGALFYLSGGRHRVSHAERPVAGLVSIVRESDSKALATFMMTPNGANSYRFTYHPSDPEPFDIEAAALDARAEMIEVEAGSAAATLRRVRN